MPNGWVAKGGGWGASLCGDDRAGGGSYGWGTPWGAETHSPKHPAHVAQMWPPFLCLGESLPLLLVDRRASQGTSILQGMGIGGGGVGVHKHPGGNTSIAATSAEHCLHPCLVLPSSTAPVQDWEKVTSTKPPIGDTGPAHGAGDISISPAPPGPPTLETQ